MGAIDLALATLALAAALAMAPWRALPPHGPPWPWLICAAALPPLWAADRLADVAVAVPLSGAVLLMLMTGWPLAMLALVPVATVTALLGGLDGWQALHRASWLGVVPATVAVALGAAVRRWLPAHLFVYILGRGFFVTAAALAVSAAAELALAPAAATLGFGDRWLARLLAAFGEAFLTGMWVAIAVAFRPGWLATYADRLYLPNDGQTRP